MEGNHESLKRLLNETECDDEGVAFGSQDEVEASDSVSQFNLPVISPPMPAAAPPSRRPDDNKPASASAAAVTTGSQLEDVMRDLSSKLDRLIFSSRQMTTEVKEITTEFQECDQRLNVVHAKVMDRHFDNDNDMWKSAANF